MSKGLSQQQKKILAILRTKQDAHDASRGAFTTDEIISELNWEYKMWLVSDGPVFHPGHPRARSALRPFETLRISVHRALQSLEKRGLIASFMRRGARWWALPERLSDWYKRAVTYSGEERKQRKILWQWGWWVRRLPPELKLTYRFGIGTPEQKEELKRRANEWKALHLT